MSGAEKLKEKILGEARLQAQANIDRARDDAGKITHAAREEAEKKAEQILDKARAEAMEKQKRLAASAQLEARKYKLQAKQEMVGEAFSGALDRLVSMPVEQYKGILVEMIADSIRTGNEEIIISARDRERLGADFIQAVNVKLAGKGIPANVKLSEETRNIAGGFILTLGNIEINNSFEAITRMRREELEADVIKTLFQA